MSNSVYIVSAVRTPMGSFQGALSSVPAPQLGAAAIKGALEAANVKPDHIDEVFMGNVLQAGVGQAPARQAAMAAGLGNHVPCTTVNKVCASGMKSIALGSQAILCGDADLVVAGGMENMSQVPHYLNGRNGVKIWQHQGTRWHVAGRSHGRLQPPMGNCAELCAKEKGISREAQDAFAIESYKRATDAWGGWEICERGGSVSVPQRRGDDVVVDCDEEHRNVKLEKIPALRPAFDREGTVTAANASTLNDGASAVFWPRRRP